MENKTNIQDDSQEAMEERDAEILDIWMKKKVPMGCPMCGTKSWYTGDEANLEKWTRSGTKFLLAVCSNCFFTAPFESGLVKESVEIDARES